MSLYAMVEESARFDLILIENKVEETNIIIIFFHDLS